MAKFQDSKYLFTKGLATGTDLFANTFQWYIDIYHVPSGKNVTFKALLNEIGDSYTQKWNSESLYGRMDNLYTFVNTARSMKLSFTVAAESLEEAIYNLNKQNLLTAFQYPSYSFIPSQGYGHANTLSAAPLVKIKFANILCDANNPNGSRAKISGLLGKMSGIEFKPDINQGMFNAEGSFFPKIHVLSFNFDVLHQHGLGWGANGKPGSVAKRAWPYAVDKSLLRRIREEAAEEAQPARREVGQNLRDNREVDPDSGTLENGENNADPSSPAANNTVDRRSLSRDVNKIVNQVKSFF